MYFEISISWNKSIFFLRKSNRLNTAVTDLVPVLKNILLEHGISKLKRSEKKRHQRA